MKPGGAAIVYGVTAVAQAVWDHAFALFVAVMWVVVVLQLVEIIGGLGDIRSALYKIERHTDP